MLYHPLPELLISSRRITMNNSTWERRTSPFAAYSVPFSSSEDPLPLTDFNPFTNSAAFGEVQATSNFGLGGPLGTTNQLQRQPPFGYDMLFEATNQQQALLYDARTNLAQSPFGVAVPAPAPDLGVSQLSTPSSVMLIGPRSGIRSPYPCHTSSSPAATHQKPLP